MKRLFTLALLLAVLLTATAHATHIQSRDFGSDDAYKLAKLATAELGDASACEKANFLLGVLDYVWANDCSIPAAITHYPSAEQGTYIGTEPDDASLTAVELIYHGYGAPTVEDAAIQTVETLEYLLPLLTLLAALFGMTLLALGLGKLHRRMGR